MLLLRRRRLRWRCAVLARLPADEAVAPDGQAGRDIRCGPLGLPQPLTLALALAPTLALALALTLTLALALTLALTLPLALALALALALPLALALALALALNLALALALALVLALLVLALPPQLTPIAPHEWPHRMFPTCQARPLLLLLAAWAVAEGGAVSTRRAAVPTCRAAVPIR